jgi:hypothetical protein
LKEIQKEVYSDTNIDSGWDIESATNLNHCKEPLTLLLNGFLQDGAKKTDKVSKAQEVVE